MSFQCNFCGMSTLSGKRKNIPREPFPVRKCVHVVEILQTTSQPSSMGLSEKETTVYLTIFPNGKLGATSPAATMVLS